MVLRAVQQWYGDNQNPVHVVSSVDKEAAVTNQCLEDVLRELQKRR